MANFVMKVSSPVALLKTYTDKQLMENNVHIDFPEAIKQLTSQNLQPTYTRTRQDLRCLPTITIDCDTTKDMDDAISIIRTAGGYGLGIHIADVSAFVTPGSILEEEAIQRGSSIYLPDRTIGMLPTILSEDLCSLAPNVDRNALSVLINLSVNGEVLDYSITKSVICSRAKCTYSGVNAFLASQKNPSSEVECMLLDMKQLAHLLLQKRIANGARTENDLVNKFQIVDDTIEMNSNVQGEAEMVIEEFMVLGNCLVAEYMKKNHLPVVYRVQKQSNKNAEYSPFELHHADLAVTCYVHFTSPIRRISDLRIHQILSAFLNGTDAEELHRLYDESMEEFCDIATRRSRRAKNIQTTCEQYCIALYFSVRENDKFTGTVDRFIGGVECLIKMDEYAICVKASWIDSKHVGQKVSFSVKVDMRTRKYSACQICKKM